MYKSDFYTKANWSENVTEKPKDVFMDKERGMIGLIGKYYGRC